jgi:hypothetical protein
MEMLLSHAVAGAVLEPVKGPDWTQVVHACGFLIRIKIKTVLNANSHLIKNGW